MSSLDVDLTLLDRGPSTAAGHVSQPPLLVAGPSLGTSVRNLWGGVAERLGSAFRVVGWDLPGHADSRPAIEFDVAGLAAAVVAAIDEYAGEPVQFHYAGDSLGGLVGLHLLLETPERLRSAVLCCTGPRIGEPDAWQERVTAVRAGGTQVLLESAPGRWFGPGFAERNPELAAALLDDLAGCDDDSYAAGCLAVAGFDARARLAEIATPVLAIAGGSDVVTPPSLLRHLAAGVQHGHAVVLDGTGHLAPAERPDAVVDLIMEHALHPDTGAAGDRDRRLSQARAQGMRVRREMLGDTHVDRAIAGTTDLTREFQDMITTYAWGGIWTRPGLDRRSRSLITLTALVAGGHHDELAMHLRAARRNGLTTEEIVETLLQTAIYCGVPEANTAFRIAQQVLGESEDEHPSKRDPEKP